MAKPRLVDNRATAEQLSISNGRGTSAVEYGLMATLIALSVVGAVTLVSQQLVSSLWKVAGSL